LVWKKPLDFGRLTQSAEAVEGDHCFRAFAVKGTAPENDDHRCAVSRAAWREREGGVVFDIQANRFLHHMVRFLVGTMLDIAEGRRDVAVIRELLAEADNSNVSQPAPPHALFLERVDYPSELYMTTE
jgi:tRNA pseudouridine38-40 synthase